MGVWIETLGKYLFNNLRSVTPFVGVWIETGFIAAIAATVESHTLRGCVD